MLLTSSNSTASVHNDRSSIIPLENLQPNEPESSPNKSEDVVPLDLSTLTMTRHKRGADDWILSSFGNSHPFHEQVSEVLSIVSMGQRNIQCHAFVHENTVYMTLPVVHGTRPIWAQNEFYTCFFISSAPFDRWLMFAAPRSPSALRRPVSCSRYEYPFQPPSSPPAPSPPPISSATLLMTCLIELAEEKTSCSSLVVIVDPKTKNNLQLNVVLRALMYIGFQLIDSRLYNQNPNYVLAGYEM